MAAIANQHTSGGGLQLQSQYTGLHGPTSRIPAVLSRSTGMRVVLFGDIILKIRFADDVTTYNIINMALFIVICHLLTNSFF
jgi:hypothetical protein